MFNRRMNPNPPDEVFDFPSIQALLEAMVQCRRCPRLVAWRETVSEVKVKRHEHELYWGRPVPSFGDPSARLLIVGLAPAAQGGNRTGRMFTGDRSGDWLYRALYKAGFANQPESRNLSDGLFLKDCYITAAAHCAPPENKPTRQEIANCRPYLSNELQLLKNLRVVIALGKLAFDTILKEPQLAWGSGKKPQFGHGLVYELPSGLTLIGSYHPSQQNTFTGKLTEPMFDVVFSQARRALDCEKAGARKSSAWEKGRL
ncbi:MAG TPA: uracil-DNA glycosylase [Oculatellaceae cyanobacterium]|jgi:uracil-DNA glycosylase family 4